MNTRAGNKIQQGSVLLTILLIMSSLSMLCFTIWRTTILSYDIALKKQEYACYQQRIKGVLEQGISLCKNQFSTLQSYLKLHKEVHIKMPPLLEKNNDHYQLKFVLVNDDTIQLESKLYEKGQAKYALSCMLIRALIAEKQNDETPSYYYAITTWKKNGFITNG